MIFLNDPPGFKITLRKFYFLTMRVFSSNFDKAPRSPILLYPGISIDMGGGVRIKC